MTLRAIAGLVVLNVFVLGVGSGVLWGLRGSRWWTDLARLVGVAYLLGLASLFVATALELVVGIPVSVPTIVVTGLSLAGCGLVVGWRRGFARPACSSGWQRSTPTLRLWRPLRRGDSRLPRGSLSCRAPRVALGVGRLAGVDERG